MANLSYLPIGIPGSGRLVFRPIYPQIVPVTTTEQPSGGWPINPYQRFPPTPEERKRQRQEWGILPRAAEVIGAVAERQAQELHLDAQQHFEELARELEAREIEWEGRYLQLLNAERERLIDLEIGEHLRLLSANNEAIISLLILAAN